MSDFYSPKFLAEIFINNSQLPNKGIAKFDPYQGLYISFCDSKQKISLSVFNRNIISNYVERILPTTDSYTFSGPNLGMYSDTADMREGPFVNHCFKKLEIIIFHEPAGKTVTVKGVADLENSGVDNYWYVGERVGEWIFSLKFIMPSSP